MIQHSMRQFEVLHKYPITQVKGPLADYRSRETDPAEQAVIDRHADQGENVIVSNYNQLKAFADREKTSVLFQEDVKPQHCQRIEVDCEGGRNGVDSTLDALADLLEPVEKSFWGIDFANQEWFVAKQKPKASDLL